MRKKISSILLGFLLVFAGIFVSACGNKYKNFEFKITYAFSENSESWYDANDGISLNYRVEDDKYVFNINGNEEKVDKNNFNIYLKVEIENVKSKHLDSITISAEGTSGLSFSSSTIKEGKTVKLPIVGLVNSQLSLYENKSGKSTKIGLSVYGLLTDIDYIVIGEIKGEEALHFITAALTGCKGMTTIHSIDAKGALDKLADYCKWASDYSRGEILKLLSCVKTIVHVDDFQVQEIVVNHGWDENTGENHLETVFDRGKGVNRI